MRYKHAFLHTIFMFIFFSIVLYITVILYTLRKYLILNFVIKITRERGKKYLFAKLNNFENNN